MLVVSLDVRFRGQTGKQSVPLSLTGSDGRSAGSLDFPTGLGHRPRDGSVVSSRRCMNDPQPEGHMASHIGRRNFLATLGGAATTWPLAADLVRRRVAVIA